MQQTLYSKPMDGYPHKHPTIQSTIYTTPTENPVFQYLQVNNYLGEFKSEVDKARVRENLGIPDEYSYNWGHIKGNIQNQSDLMAILNQLTKKQSSLESQLLGVSSIVNQLAGTGEQDQITVNQLYSQFLDLKINVAQNSTDITSLITGGDTTLSTQVSANLNNINLLKDRVQALENRPQVDQTLSNRVTALENRVDHDTIYDDTAIQASINNLNSRVEQLQREIGSNTLIRLKTAITTYNDLTPTAEDIPISIVAEYSQMKDKDVTELCETSSSNRNIAIFNAETKKIEILDGIEETSSVSITFTYGEQSIIITLNIVVEEEQPVIQYKQYVGWANNEGQVKLNSSFECDSIAKTWGVDTPKMGSGDIWYFIIYTTQNLKNVKNSFVTYNPDDIKLGQDTLNGITYNVYKIGPTLYTDAVMEIEIL